MIILNMAANALIECGQGVTKEILRAGNGAQLQKGA